MEFKVGDHVKIVRVECGTSVYPEDIIGKTGVIIRDRGVGFPYVLKLDDGTQIKEGFNCFNESELEVIPMEKFKVGDKVKILDRETLVAHQRELIGKTFEVTKVYPNRGLSGNKYMLSDTKDVLYYENELELVPATEFKVGDKVITNGTSNKYGNTETMERYAKDSVVGEITRIDSDGCYRVKFPGEVYSYEKHNLELAKEETKVEFKVGDTVKIIGGCPGRLSMYFGTTQVIKSMDSSVYRMVGLPDTIGSHSTYWFEDELELVPREMTKAEALKAAIDGAKVTNSHWTSRDSYVFFDGKRLMWRNSLNDAVANGVLDHETGWTLYKEPEKKPKFSKGDLFIAKDGYVGKVLEYNGNLKYTVTFNFRDEHSKVDDYPEERMVSKFTA